MRILLTGPTGQVGSALLDTLPSLGEVIPLDRSQLDLADPASIRAAVRQVRPDVIVNAAAYTAVDQAEKEEATNFRINADGPAVLAEEAGKLGARLVHFSTDYVFDGEKAEQYVETDAPHPLNAYGRAKLAGEQAIGASGCRYLVLRTGWVYAPKGRNFMLTMLRLAREGKHIRVVDDQYGAPTSSAMIARATAQTLRKWLIEKADADGVYHMTAGGSTTWYRFAVAIFEGAGVVARVTPTSTAEYPTAAVRPCNSVLGTTKLQKTFDVGLVPWDEGLRDVLRIVG